MRSSHSSAQHRRRTRYTDGIAQKVIVRERDPGKWLAASLIKRALRHAGLRAVLHGSSGAVGFIVPHSQDLSLFRDAGQSLLLSLAKNRDFDALFIDDTDRN